MLVLFLEILLDQWRWNEIYDKISLKSWNSTVKKRLEKLRIASTEAIHNFWNRKDRQSPSRNSLKTFHENFSAASLDFLFFFGFMDAR
jgi:hypothetical protein